MFHPKGDMIPTATYGSLEHAQEEREGNVSLDQPEKSGDDRQRQTWINLFRQVVIGQINESLDQSEKSDGDRPEGGHCP